MYAERVDPMERTFHAPSPRLQAGEDNEEEGVPSYRSTNLDFWKGFNKNQKYLQAKSAADLRKTMARKQREKKRPPPKKTNPLLLTRGKPMQRELVQDQKTPSRNLACKLRPPAHALGGSGGPVYEVEDLLRFARKKPGPHYCPQPLPQDDYARGTAGVVYQYHPPEEEEKEDEEEKGGTGAGGDFQRTHKQGMEELQGQGQGQGQEGQEEGNPRPSEHLDASSSFPLLSTNDTNDNDNDNNAFQESFTSNTLGKHSFASGTVVPSLNLSAVLASQISGSQSHSHSQTNKKTEDGGVDDKNTVDDTDDNRTGVDESNTHGNSTFGQQPSFAFTEGGNEDFLFAKSMMEDEGNTFATNTLMGDDLTKATLPTTCQHGALGKSGTKAPQSAKHKRREEREREAKKQLLRPVIGVYGDIGSNVKGGQLAQSPSRPPPGSSTFPAPSLSLYQGI